MRLRYILKDRRVVYIIFAFMFAVLLSLLTVLLIDMKSDAKDCSYIYKSIRIEDGDTLEGIAGRFLSYSGMSSHSDYVKEISRVNRLSSDKIISGAYLAIPVIEMD